MINNKHLVLPMQRTATLFMAIIMAVVVMGFSNTIWAGPLQAPSFVNTVDASALESAGDTLKTWIYAFMAIVVALSCVRPGYYFVTGKAQEGVESAKDILIGVVISVVLGGIAFAVASRLG